MEREVFINDNVIIPDNIMKMTRSERQAEIRRLENEARRERDRIHTKKIVINDKELGLKKKAQPAF